MTFKLMLDSGAFSAWKQKDTIDLGAYIEFIHKHKSMLDTVVNLDVIPGVAGQQPSAAVVEESAAKGLKNLKKLKAEGIDAMPVFHQGERFYWLEAMLDLGCDYIGLSPRKDRTTKQKRMWLESAFAYLCGKRGYPEVRTHAFGETSASILLNYPWYSADSTSWMIVAGYGNIMVPRRRFGGWDWDASPRVVSISSQESRRSAKKNKSELAGNAYSQLSPDAQKAVVEWVEECGQTLEGVQSDYINRCKCAIYYYRAVSQEHSLRPFTARNLGLFRDFDKARKGAKKPVAPHYTQIYTVTSADHFLRLLDEYEITDRLVSYWHFVQNERLTLDYFANPQPTDGPKLTTTGS